MTFEELLKENGVAIAPPSHEHARSGWVNFDCPFCSPNWRHYRMGYNSRGGYVNCYACGKHKLFDVLVNILSATPGQVAKLLKTLDRPSTIFDAPTRGKLVLPKGVAPLLDQHKQYLKRRKFSPSQLVKLWGIGGIGISSKLPWRIFIPLFYRGRMVSWTTRSIVDDGQRYLSASPNEEAIDHKSLLYGEDYCRHAIVVCEGPTDVWRIGPGAVCTFGTGFKQSQVEKITKYPIRVVCYDNSPDAQRQAAELCNLIEPFPGETYNVVLSSKDPGEGSQEEINKIRTQFLGIKI